MLNHIAELSDWLTPERVENVAIALGGAVIGTFGGAYGGARAADAIATRKLQWQKLYDELVETNAAISLASGVCQRVLMLKADYVRQMHGEFVLAKRAIELHHAEALGGAPVGPIPVELNFRRIEACRAPAERLEAVVLEKIGIQGRPLHLAIALSESLGSLNEQLAIRNKLIDELKDADMPGDQLVKLVYGVELDDGTVDTSFADAVDGINKRTNNCIWFARQLVEDLLAHSVKLRQRLPKRTRARLPGLTRPYFHEAVALELFPENDDYGSWRVSFVGPVPKSRGRWLQRIAFAFWKPLRSALRAVNMRPGWLFYSAGHNP